MPHDARAELSEQFARHTRLLHALRSETTAIMPAGIDPAAIGLLITIVRRQPVHQAAVAEQCSLDPSTISRYVRQLVRGELVVQQRNPDDRRIVQLHASHRGQQLAATLAAQRAELTRELLADWSDRDVRELLRLMTKLNHNMENRRPGGHA